jgi:AcrR family transcriptional regulator
MRKGLSSLSLQAVASEAGELKSTIAYHFGDKAGLISALTDSLLYDTDAALLSAAEKTPIGPDRVRMLIDAQRGIAAMDEYWRLLYGLFPQIARDSRLRARFVELFETYWAIQIDVLGLPRDGEQYRKSRLIASLTLAVLEGFAFQRQLMPKDYDLAAHFDLWQSILEPYLRTAFGAADGLTQEDDEAVNRPQTEPGGGSVSSQAEAARPAQDRESATELNLRPPGGGKCGGAQPARRRPVKQPKHVTKGGVDALRRQGGRPAHALHDLSDHARLGLAVD